MAALAQRPSLLVDRLRDEIIRSGARHGMGNVRVFGSCLHGTDVPGSDVDLLVTPERGASLLDLVAFQEVEDLLGVRVDGCLSRRSQICAGGSVSTLGDLGRTTRARVEAFLQPGLDDALVGFAGSDSQHEVHGSAGGDLEVKVVEGEEHG